MIMNNNEKALEKMIKSVERLHKDHWQFSCHQILIKKLYRLCAMVIYLPENVLQIFS